MAIVASDTGNSSIAAVDTQISEAIGTVEVTLADDDEYVDDEELNEEDIDAEADVVVDQTLEEIICELYNGIEHDYIEATVAIPPPVYEIWMECNYSINVAILGDASVGKTSFMIQYIHHIYNDNYTPTISTYTMSKDIPLADASKPNTAATASSSTTENVLHLMLTEIGGQSEFHDRLPIVIGDKCYGVLILFDLCRYNTLVSAKEWYRKVKSMNKRVKVVLVGTKYDQLIYMPTVHQRLVDRTVRKYSKMMSAPVVYTSASSCANIEKPLKILMSKLFNHFQLNEKEVTNIGDLLCIHKNV